MYQKEQLQNAFVSEAQTKNFYDTNVEKFNFPDSIEIANIIMKTQPEAEVILNQLKSSVNLDEDFIRVAREHKQNGYMGWFGKGMVPEQVLEALKSKIDSLYSSANIVY